jgi:lipopolysaccharide/colanic/teichoic acid biosynthesis glycosyltransferase
MAFLHEKMPTRLAQARIRVTPGVTGLWQVSEACHRLILETPHYDLFYLHHRNLRLDLWIAWRTVLKFLHVGQPVTLEMIPSWVVPPHRRTSIEGAGELLEQGMA